MEDAVRGVGFMKMLRKMCVLYLVFACASVFR